jgi:hypothetical protein
VAKYNIAKEGEKGRMEINGTVITPMEGAKTEEIAMISESFDKLKMKAGLGLGFRKESFMCAYANEFAQMIYLAEATGEKDKVKEGLSYLKQIMELMEEDRENLKEKVSKTKRDLDDLHNILGRLFNDKDML